MAEAQPTSMFSLRRATESDIPTIQEIEHAGTARFQDIPGLADLHGGFFTPVEKIRNWLVQGRVYVAKGGEQDVGFIAAFPMDTTLLVNNVSVDPKYHGKGVGSLLLNAIFEWARERDPPRVSLATYREVPWNKPWYAKRGFIEVEPETLGPKHVEKMSLDRDRGLERQGYTRCCMLWEP